MASHVYVVDASARRTMIKTQPNTHLRTVLDEACSKMKLDPEHYSLKNGNKLLDLSLTIRLSGLVSGAKLQLTQASRSPSVVSVALQLPESEKTPRLQDQFPSNTSLWLVLRKFEEGVAGGQKLNLTQRGVPSTDSGAGRLCYEQPCMNAMGRELASFIDLQKTLAQLGYNSGSVMFRVSFKNGSVPMEEAMTQITQYFGAVDAPQKGTAAETNPAHGAHANDDMNMSSLPDASAENAAVPDDVAGQDPSDDTIKTPPPPPSSLAPAQDDNIIASSSETAIPSTASQFPSFAEPSPATPSLSVYRAPSGSAPAAALAPHNEADFIPTVDHAKSHQATLSRAAVNKRLQSDAELASASATKAATLSAIKSLHLRIRFPDQMFVDMVQGPEASIAHLYASVADMLADPSLRFQLRYPGPKGVHTPLEPTTSERTLIAGLGLVGRVMMTCVWDASVSEASRAKPVLKESLRAEARELEVQVQQQQTQQSEAESEGAAKKEEEGKRKAPRDKGDVEARLKKLMMFGKKK